MVDSNVRPIFVAATGEHPVQIVDDVFTNTVRSLAPGAEEGFQPPPLELTGDEEEEGFEPGRLYRSSALGKPDDDGGWEPPPLPAPPTEEGDWRPEELPIHMAADFEIAAPSPDLLEISSETIDLVKGGQTVAVKLHSTGELKLSHLSGLAEAAVSGPGRVVIELSDDG